MTTAPLPLGHTRTERGAPALLRVRALWAAVSILVMWIAVIVVAIVGPDIVSHSGVSDVGSETTVPSAVAVAFFAAVATIFVAWFGFRGSDEPAE